MKLLRARLAAALAATFCAASAAADTTYAGTLSCADCAGQAVVLTLFDNGSFSMQTRHLGARPALQEPFHDLGRWGRDGDGRVVLSGGREAPMWWAPTRDGLKLLDQHGKPIEPVHKHELRRQPVLDRIAGPMRLRGMYFYLADAASLDECLSGQRWPVLIEGDHLSLERAYLAQRQQGGGDWGLASFDARFVLREPEPGLPLREVLTVERFDRLWPRETCAADAPGTAALLNTRWRLVEIDGRPVTLAEQQREPFLQLSATGNLVRGFGGCNCFSGRFEQGSDGLLFKNLAVAHRACPGAGGEHQAAYLAALQAVASRRIVGEALHLSDAQGRVRLRFEALYLR